MSLINTCKIVFDIFVSWCDNWPPFPYLDEGDKTTYKKRGRGVCAVYLKYTFLVNETKNPLHFGYGRSTLVTEIVNYGQNRTIVAIDVTVK